MEGKAMMINEENKIRMDTQMVSLMEEQLNQEALMYKKYLSFAEKIYDSELKNILYTASEKHKGNYLNILSYLKL